jgi:hypothetical protein
LGQVEQRGDFFERQKFAIPSGTIQQAKLVKDSPGT